MSDANGKKQELGEYGLTLDMGTSSIGWAVFKTKEDKEGRHRIDPFGLRNGGVMIFSGDSSAKDKDKTPAACRREKRGARRQGDRRIKRGKRLLKELVKLKWIEDNKEGRDKFFKLNPYECRANALDKELSKMELGRALYGLSKRRGFKSNSLRADKDGGKTGKRNRELWNRIGDCKTVGQYFWEIIKENREKDNTKEEKDKIRERIRGVEKICLSRKMIEDELNEIWAAQERKGTEVKKEEYNELREIVEFQRPLRPVERGVCSIYEDKKRAFRAYPIFQKFRTLQELHDLSEKKGQSKQLSDDEIKKRNDEIKKLLHFIWDKKWDKQDRRQRLKEVGEHIGQELTWGNQDKTHPVLKNETADLIRKDIDKKKEEEEKKEKEVWKGWKGWDKLTFDQQQEIVETLFEHEKHEKLRKTHEKLREEFGVEKCEDKHKVHWQDLVCKWLELEHGLSGDEAEAVLVKLHNNSAMKQTCAFSTKALRKLCDLIEKGMKPLDAIKELRNKPEQKDKRRILEKGPLPHYGYVLREYVQNYDPGKKCTCKARSLKKEERDINCTCEARWGRINNPVVHVGLNMLRRLINELVKKYGKPKEIVVELARDLKKSKAERDKITNRNAKEKKENDEIRKKLSEIGFTDSRKNMKKYELWEAQDQRCLYTGDNISWKNLFGKGEVQIDHIVPVPVDDRDVNKALCFTTANQAKGCKTPHEYFGKEKSDEIKERYKDRLRHKKYGIAKDLKDKKREEVIEGECWRFEEDARAKAEEKVTPGRLLNDTRFLSRATKMYLERFINPDSTFDAGDKGEKGYEYKENHVSVFNGRLTALTRGVLELKRKDRNDHAHHLIDACTLGVLTRSLNQLVNTATGKDELKEWVKEKAGKDKAGFLKDLVDWKLGKDGFSKKKKKEFKDEVEKLVKKCTVWHRPNHFQSKKKGSTWGQLVKETAMGLIPDDKAKEILKDQVDKLDEKLKGSRLVQYYVGVFDKKMETILKREPGKKDGWIKDRALREKIQEKLGPLKEKLGPLKEKLKTLEKDAKKEKIKEEVKKIKEEVKKIKEEVKKIKEKEIGNVRRVRVLELVNKKSLALIEDKYEGREYDIRPKSLRGNQGENETYHHKAYKTGSNAYVDIWKIPGEKKPSYKMEVVSVYEAHMRALDPERQSEIKKKPGAKRLVRLHIDDMVASGEVNSGKIYRVAELIGGATPKINMVHHREVRAFGNAEREKKFGDYTKITRSSGKTFIDGGWRRVSVSPLGVVWDPLDPVPTRRD